MSRIPKFLSLTHRLLGLPADQPSVRVSFTELQTLSGNPLPRGAWTSGYWRNSTVSRRNWQRFGFQATLDRPTRSVLFFRDGGSIG